MDEYIAKINRAHEMGLRMGKVLALADFQILVMGLIEKAQDVDPENKLYDDLTRLSSNIYQQRIKAERAVDELSSPIS
jgi:hypothetical protein